MRRGIVRAALRCVPRDWREGVERDLSDECAGTWRFVSRAVAIGVRLRYSRVRDAVTLPKGRPMRDFGRDLRFALRGVVRRPAYALAVIATLGIGIGANTAIFSVFNWILFRPLPGVLRPDELVTIRFLREGSEGRFFVSYRDVADLQGGMPALSGLAASASLAMNAVLAPGADPMRLDGELVTANYFDVLGVRSARGRTFRPDEERPGAETPPAVISDALWRRAYGSAADAIGRSLTINGRPLVIVGIAPPGFRGPTLVAATDLWVPMAGGQAAMPTRSLTLMTDRRQTLFLDAIGRLRPGATIAQAQDQARAIAAAVPDYGGRRAGSGRGGIVPTLFPGIGLDTFATERLATLWQLLAGAVGLVLLLACANAANLLLARALGRRREIAVCQAIGASRLRLVRQQFAEGLVLALLAGGAGFAVARLLTGAFDGMRVVNYLPTIERIGVDWRVGAFTIAVAVGTGILFSLAPAMASSRLNLQASLKDGLTSSRHGRGRLTSTLVAVQIAVSVLLLVGAGLFVRTLHNVRALDLGVNLDGLVTFSADPTMLGYDETRARNYFETFLDRLRSTPGIDGAAFVLSPPYSNMLSDGSFTRAEGSDRTEHYAGNTYVSRGYFDSLGIPIVAGRDFTEAEARTVGNDVSGVVIVSERLAREAFPEGGALGSHLVLSYPKGKTVEIVGIAGNARRRPVTNEPEPFLYFPGISGWWGSVAVRSSLPIAETASAIRAIAHDLDPSLPPYDVEPMSAGLDRVISEQRLLARFSGLFAVIAALLAAIGIYGMMAGAVAERRREFGIRLALGARAQGVLALVLRGALPVAALGVAAGLAGSLALGRALASRLYGVQPTDPLTLALVVAALAVLALAASLVPALRASRVDPVQSLRVE